MLKTKTWPSMWIMTKCCEILYSIIPFMYTCVIYKRNCNTHSVHQTLTTFLEWNVHAYFNTGSPMCRLKLCETTVSTKIYQSKSGGHGFYSHFYSNKKYKYLDPLLPFGEHLQIYPYLMCTLLNNNKNKRTYKNYRTIFLCWLITWHSHNTISKYICTHTDKQHIYIYHVEGNFQDP